jgi:hypothetical protein
VPVVRVGAAVSVPAQWSPAIASAAPIAAVSEVLEIVK